MDEDELEALFAQALESTSRRVKVKPSPKPPRAELDVDDLPLNDEDSIHIHIDESEELREDIARLFSPEHKSPGADEGDLELPPLNDDDDENEWGLPEADDILATLDGFDDSPTAALADAPTVDDPGGFDELDRELQAALDDEDDAEEDILQAAMERLLAESFGVDGKTGDDFSLPESPPQAGDDEILALGDDGAISLEELREAELASLRTQVGELARSLTIKDLEFRTQEDRIDTLEQQVVAATRQAAGVAREFESFRRRVEREKDDLKKFAAEKTLKEFLVVFDNLDRAIQHAGADRTTGLGQGVEMILGQFMSALRRCGAEEVPSGPDEPFDPQWHEAVGQEYSAEIASGNIAKQLVTGFALNGRLLRAAMVSVSRGAAPDPEAPIGESAASEDKSAVSEDESEAAAGEQAEVAGESAAAAEEVIEAAPKKKRTRKTSGAAKKTRSRKRKAAAAKQPTDDKAAETEAKDADVAADESNADTESATTEVGDVAEIVPEPAPPAKKKRRRRKKAPKTGAEE
jgi:molecular chaperone GrpE